MPSFRICCHRVVLGQRWRATCGEAPREGGRRHWCTPSSTRAPGNRPLPSYCFMSMLRNASSKASTATSLSLAPEAHTVHTSSSLHALGALTNPCTVCATGQHRWLLAYCIRGGRCVPRQRARPSLAAGGGVRPFRRRSGAGEHACLSLIWQPAFYPLDLAWLGLT